MLSANNFTNLVEFPTRVCDSTATCLDHVYSNRQAGLDSASAVDTSRDTPDDPLSDHLAVRTELVCRPRQPPPRAVLVRNFSEANRLNFAAAISSVDWDHLYQKYDDSPDSLATAVINVLKSNFHICFPLKRKSVRKRSWVSDEVLEIRALLYESSQLTEKFPENDHLMTFHEELAMLYDKTLCDRKSSFYTKIISESSSKSKAVWSVVNTERGVSKKAGIGFAEVIRDKNGGKFISKKVAADHLNTRFVEAAAACGAPRASLALASAALGAARASPATSMRLVPFTAGEVYRIINRIPCKPTKDIYDISMELVSLVKVQLAPLLAELYNRCMRAGVYPSAMKLSKISPLFKGKGKRDDPDSYRPVSIIPAIAKIFENGLSSRLSAYLASTEALSERQFAYRAGRSTTELAREVVKSVLGACDRKLRVAVLCCDLSRAFDVADRSVLAAKLAHYGINGPAHALFTSLLRDRSQIVVGDGGVTRSDAMETDMGVAQGSSVSNILFSLLLNDLPDCIAAGGAYMYADDVACIVTGKSSSELQDSLNKTASELAKWFNHNGLVLNLKKTHFIYFSVSGRSQDNLKVVIDGNKIDEVDSTTFLGFELDRGLTWSSHIDKLCAKLGSACFALGRLSKVVSADVVRTCYFATVHSVLQYGTELWGHAADRLRAFRMQKRAIRAIAQVSRRTSARPLFKSLGIMTLPSMVVYQWALYVRLNLNLFKTRGDQYSGTMDLRCADMLATPHVRLARAGNLTHVRGPEVYNCLPAEITSTSSDSIFKNKLKNWLVLQSFYTIDEFLNTNKRSYLNINGKICVK